MELTKQEESLLQRIPYKLRAKILGWSGEPESERKALENRILKQDKEIAKLKEKLKKVKSTKHHKIPHKELGKKTMKSISQLDYHTGEVLATYKSIREASESVQVTYSALRDYFFRDRDQCGGFKWVKVAQLRDCSECGKRKQTERDFPTAGQKNGVKRFSHVCKSCYYEYNKERNKKQKKSLVNKTIN